MASLELAVSCWVAGEPSDVGHADYIAVQVGFKNAGCVVFDYGNNIRGQAERAGYKEAFEFPGFVPAYIRPLFCEGKGPFRWVALSGEEEI